MDKIFNLFLKDISFRKSNKKVIYPTPKVNPRAISFTSTDELCGMKAALEDERRGIMQVAFITEPEEGASSRVVIPGKTGEDMG